jgi:transcriptional regulator with XRE-family HTH domain
MSSLGARLKQERERLGMTQVEMAEVASVTRVSQQNYENDRRIPDAEYLGALYKIGVNILYVITGEPDPN